jgi:hypothetical protein
MKPRLRRIHGIWTCRYVDCVRLLIVTGHGYTPQDAYLDCQAQWKREAQA